MCMMHTYDLIYRWILQIMKWLIKRFNVGKITPNTSKPTDSIYFFLVRFFHLDFDQFGQYCTFNRFEELNYRYISTLFIICFFNVFPIFLFLCIIHIHIDTPYLFSFFSLRYLKHFLLLLVICNSKFYVRIRKDFHFISYSYECVFLLYIFFLLAQKRRRNIINKEAEYTYVL